METIRCGLTEEGIAVQEEYLGCEYIVIKALENGVTIIGLTRGAETKFHHTEKLDKGEIMVVQFTEHTSAMKIRGNAEITHRYGTTLSESSRR
ncbi:MAG: trp RNA-binding attenuation protein MtrB [Syntrophomonadaceae bacterium]|nr:trp RNA-binding attenuation protein MtrB [Syntrophomonadaceae bacterium]